MYKKIKLKTRNFKPVCGQERKMKKKAPSVADKNEIVVYQPESGESTESNMHILHKALSKYRPISTKKTIFNTIERSRNT